MKFNIYFITLFMLGLSVTNYCSAPSQTTQQEIIDEGPVPLTSEQQEEYIQQFGIPEEVVAKEIDEVAEGIAEPQQ